MSLVILHIWHPSPTISFPERTPSLLQRSCLVFLIGLVMLISLFSSSADLCLVFKIWTNCDFNSCHNDVVRFILYAVCNHVYYWIYFMADDFLELIFL